MQSTHFGCNLTLSFVFTTVTRFYIRTLFTSIIYAFSNYLHINTTIFIIKLLTLFLNFRLFCVILKPFLFLVLSLEMFPISMISVLMFYKCLSCFIGNIGYRLLEFLHQHAGEIEIGHKKYHGKYDKEHQHTIINPNTTNSAWRKIDL